MDTCRSIHLIANNIIFDVICPYEVIPGLQLRKPTSIELQRLRELVANSCNGSMGWYAPYEMNWVPEGHNDGNSYRGEDIKDPESWKYWVLADKKGGRVVHELSNVTLLIDPAIELALSISFMGGPDEKELVGYSGVSHHVGERHWGMSSRSKYRPNTVGVGHLALLRQLYDKLNGLDDSYSFITNALRTFNQARRISDYSDLRVVGFFAVIESLITHAPRLSETLDSISHQIRGKMILLNKRFDSPVEIPKGFTEMSEEAMWTKLYAYRSIVAHGQRPSFDKKLSPLKDRSSVHRYLENACRALLRFALNEPQLIADLREC